LEHVVENAKLFYLTYQKLNLFILCIVKYDRYGSYSLLKVAKHNVQFFKAFISDEWSLLHYF
jgi:hypothetical protein